MMKLVLATNIFGVDVFKDLGKNVSQWNPSGWKYVTNIVTNVTIKVGLYLLVFFLIMEVAKIYQKANAQNNGHVEADTLLQATIYALLAGALVTGSLFLLQFMGQIIYGAIKLISAGNYGQYGMAEVSVGSQPHWYDGFGAIVAWLLTYLLEIGAWLVAAVLITIRWVQLYILAIFAPISFATFASSEYRSIGVGYAKNYFAYLIQGVVMIIIFGLYHVLTNGFNDAPKDAPFLADFVLPLCLIVLLIQSNKIAKTIVGLGL